MSRTLSPRPSAGPRDQVTVLGLTAAACGVLAGSGAAQSVHWQSDPFPAGVHRCESGGDFDGDGLADVLLSVDNSTFTILRGTDMAVIGEYAPADFIGWATPIGDLTGDGVQEVMYTAGLGEVSVVRGGTESVLYTGALGSATTYGPLGDVNGDTIPDVYFSSASAAGKVTVVSGRFIATGLGQEILWTRLGTQMNGGFGWSTTPLGDVDGDGLNDICVSAPNETGQAGLFQYHARLHMLSGADGSIIWTRNFIPTTTSGSDVDYGISLNVTPDRNGDGIDEILVGAPRANTPTNDAGRVDIISGAGGIVSIIEGSATSGRFGTNVEGVGDVDDDGIADILIAAPGESRVYLYSGATLTPLTQYLGGGPFGGFERMSGGTDATGDGISDFVLVDAVDLTVTLYKGDCEGMISAYCTGAPNSASTAGSSISVFGLTSISANDMVLSASSCPPGQPGVFFYGNATAQTAFGDGTLCVSGAIQRLNPPVVSSGAGVATRAIDFTVTPFDSGPGSVAPGDVRFFQYWYRDPGGPGGNGFNLGNAAEVRFCP